VSAAFLSGKGTQGRHMRVEKLELIGFKSFGDRTVFNLHSGITCIVGPNGCGKSNVVDSFKWVLGEQSAKSLRGGKMEEVIFAGSQNKKPRGMSDVTLTISGLGAQGNGKENLTTVTRRLYRSGDSDYLLNKNSCRLRDIKDIFLDTGLEVKSYSIMEQDRISAILGAKPEERRFLIEEVAGVVKYKVRRTEALSKLESSRNNLQRITDITAEVKRQINSLDRQVKKAERYKRLSEELKGIELRVAKRDYEDLSERLREVLKLHASLKEEDALMRAELSQAETEIEARRIQVVDGEKALGLLRQELQGIEREMAEAERLSAVSMTEKENLKEYTLKLNTQETENRTKSGDAERKKREIAESIGALQKDVEELRVRVDEKANTLGTAEEDIRGIEHLLENKRREESSTSEGLAELRNELNKHSAAVENLQRSEEGLQKESDELGATLETATSQLKDLEFEMRSKNNEAIVMKDGLESMGNEIETLGARLEQLRTDTARGREDLASATSRLESLKEMAVSESSEGALKEDVKLISAISDALEVEERYERAIEAGLKDLINGFVVSSIDDIKQAVRAVKGKGIERTAFMAMGPESNPSLSELPESAIGRASDLVRAKDEFSRIIKSLLGVVVVVSDLDTALALKNVGRTVVTLEGETVEPTGAVTAGRNRGILSLKRQIRGLEEEVENKKTRVGKLERDTAEAVRNLQQKENEQKELNERIIESEKALSLLRARAERLGEEIEQMQRKLAAIRLKREETARERNSLGALMEEKQQEIGRAVERKGIVEAEISELQKDISSKRAFLEEKRNDSVNARLSLNSGVERLNALRSEEAATANLLNELNEKGIFIQNEQTHTAQRIREKEEVAAAKGEILKGLAVRAQEISARVSEKSGVIVGESEELMGKERELKAMRAKIDGVAHELSELDVKRTENSVRVENLEENIKNAYNVELKTYEAEPVTEEDEERLPALKEKIERIGPVSLGSIEEYEELKERYDFLNKQQEDLQLSIAELEEAIKRINSTTRKRLREAYDALKAKFSEVFKDLFGGGHAELVLTDEQNILETGIDVIAQPPGKKLRNISLLSGGEKTLTALALLFSSFLIKPTPLCILDEADAALDEANTHKFAEMLKGLAKEIQFVVITHNRVTMESADYIYGVTMEEPGISKVISLELSEA
jgi:chromosome segregation protein